MDPFAASASVYKYSFGASGDVTFFRKPSYNSQGGYLTIKQNDIQQALAGSAAYIASLDTLKFEDKNKAGNDKCTVPKEERPCVEKDLQGYCLKRICPTLAGNDIGSINIKGDYLVLLIYFDSSLPGGQSKKWSTCQAYPSMSDINKNGPRQIKWDYIHSENKEPNYVLIFPIKSKY